MCFLHMNYSQLFSRNLYPTFSGEIAVSETGLFLVIYAFEGC